MKSLLNLGIAILFLAACQNNDDTNLFAKPPTGTITGKILSKNANKPVGGANIFTFDEAGNFYHTISDSNGKFNLAIPQGERKIHIQTGDGTSFRTEIEVEIAENQQIKLEKEKTLLKQVAKFGFVSGNYDKIQAIITNLGYTSSQIQLEQMTQMNEISSYDVIFLNCSSRSGNFTKYELIDRNLSNFVSNGGSLYASDWDLAYLMGGLHYTPDCDENGGFIPDHLLCSDINTAAGTLENCSIACSDLQNAVGFNSLDIDFNLSAWQKILSYDQDFWEVLVKHNSEALMLKTNKYKNTNAPQLIIGNAGNDDFVKVCYNPPGRKPISISIHQDTWSAIKNRENHLTLCDSTEKSGNIFYTSFHNEAEENIGNSEKILEYVIMNL